MVPGNDLELHIGTTADSSGLHDAARELDKTKHSSDDMGKSFHETGKQSHDLDAEIAKLQGHIKELGQEYSQTGNRDLFKAIRADRSALSNLEQIKRDLADSANSGDKIAEAFKAATGDAHTLDEEIKALKAHILELGRSYQASGDSSILGLIGKDRSRLSSLERIKNDIKDVTRETSVWESTAQTAFGALSEAGSAFTKTISDGFSGTPIGGILIGSLVGAAVAAAPAIGAAVSGAVAGLTGLGGIAGGIASASRSPLVRSAAQRFSAEISSSFFGGASSTAFVKPTVDALSILSHDFKSLDLGSAFAKAAPYVTLLAHGVGDFMKNIMPGFNAIMDKSGAIISIIADGLAGTGSALGSFLSDIAGSKGTLEGLQGTFMIINGTIAGLGHTLGWLGDRFDDFLQINDAVGHGLEKLTGWIPGTGDAIRYLTRPFDELTGSGDGVISTMHAFNPVAASAAAALAQITGNTDTGTVAFQRYTVALQDANQAMDDALDQRHALNQALLAEKQGWVDLTATLDHKQGLNLKEQQAIEQQAEAIERARRAAIKAGGDTLEAQDKADRAYDKAIERLLAMAKAAGATPAELAKLKSDYYITLHVRSILEQTGGRGGPAYDSSDVAHQHAPHRAGGGSVMPGMPYMINERAGKEVYFPAGGRVAPASLNPAWGAAPTGSLALTVMPGGSDAFTRALVELISTYVRVSGNGNGAALGIKRV